MNVPTVSNRSTAPAELDELDILADGSVGLRQERTTLDFSFRTCRLAFSAAARLMESGPVPQIAGDIAGDPYSVEGADMRQTVHAIIRSSHASSSCRLVVSRQKRIYCAGRARLDDTSTPTALVAAAAELIFEARPYLMVLAPYCRGGRNRRSGLDHFAFTSAVSSSSLWCSSSSSRSLLRLTW